MNQINKWLINLLQGLINLLKGKDQESILKTPVEVKTPTKKSTEVKDTNFAINLLIIRDTFTKDSTIGKLFLNGELFCETLELPYLDNQRRISCIPAGQYLVRLRYPRESATRNYLHLLVQNVPDRDYILFHIGNKPEDTNGCILVGLKRQQDFVNNSKRAMDLLIKKIIHLGGKNINLIIKNN
jgi:hypothetical protein